MLANPKISWQNWEAAGFAGKNKRPRKIDEASFCQHIWYNNSMASEGSTT
jgi:hypothetical protein